MPDIPNQPTEAADSAGNSASAHLREIGKQLNDVLGLLRTQRDMLKQRGVNLPAGALDDVRNLKKTVDDLTKSILDGQQELRSLRALAETTALVNSSQKTHEVLNQVMDTVIALTGAERGYIVLKNPETKALEFKIARGMDQATLDNANGGMIISRTIVNNVADSGNPVLTDNAAADERYQSQESIVSFALRSILAVPLKVRNEVIGVVYCDNRFMSGLFKHSELDVLTAFANQAAVAVENARLFESSRNKLSEVSELRERMDNLFKSITSAVITIDQDNIILIANAAAEEMTQQKGIIGKNFAQVIPNLPPLFVQNIDLIRSTNRQRSFDLDLEIRGRKRSWSVVASPLRNDEGGRNGIAMVIDDMTEQKKSESQLMEVRRYLPVALMDDSIDMSKVQIEERVVTALFADVRGFTTFSERLEPEELMTVINKYLSLASDAINLFEGIVDKYMGDAVTGLFNTQLNPQADHPTRAIQAALQLVIDLHAQHEVMPAHERLFYGIGVHTGAAVLGNVGGEGRKEFSALGDAPDICKFLQEQAGPGEIVISEETYLLVEDQFEVELITNLNRPKAGYEHIKCYRVLKRKRTSSSLFVDEELLALLAGSDDDDDD